MVRDESDLMDLGVDRLDFVVASTGMSTSRSSAYNPRQSAKTPKM